MKKLKNLELFDGTVEPYCVPVNSDSLELQNCPFITREYDDSPVSSPSLALTPSSQPTGILMLSLPSTADSDTKSSLHEEFETPPEHNYSSQPYFSGSDDPNPIAAVDFQGNGDTDSVNHDVAVNLGNDCDDLGFNNRGAFDEQMSKRIRVSDEERVVIEVDGTQEVDTEVVMEEVDEGGILKKSDSFTGKMSGEEGDGGEVHENGYNEKLNGVVGRGVEESMNLDENDKLKGFVGGRGVEENMNLDESEKVKGVVCDDGRRGVEESMNLAEKLKGIVRDDDGGGGVMETMNLDKNDKLKGVVGEDGGRGMEDSMNLGESDKLNGVGVKKRHSDGITRGVDSGGGGASGSVEERRELPLSMRRGDKNNVGLMEGVGKAAKTGKFKDLMEALSKVLGDTGGGGDYFETAQRRGMNFPRPRWWPPEGFDD